MSKRCGIRASSTSASGRKASASLAFVSAGLQLLVSILSCAPSPAPEIAITYEDVAAVSGLDFIHYNGFSGNYYFVETVGSGAAFVDFDGDGWLDIYLVDGAPLTGPGPDPPPSNRLYRSSKGESFSDVSAQVGAADSGYGMGCAVADYDGDGDQDLFVANFGPDALYRNEEGGSFSDVTTTMGIGDPRWGTSAAFLDADNDGDLDLYVTGYVDFSVKDNIVCEQGKVRSYCEPEIYNPIRDLLYRNDESRFTDITEEAGVTLVGRGMGVALSDYDLDGDTDIYVANDGTMNFLYQNHCGNFVDVGLQAGTRHNAEGRAEHGMGVDFGDFDNDGDQDLFVTNFAYETHTFYSNDGHGQFFDVTARLGLAEPTFSPLGFGTKFVDFDNDADLDLFVVNGHVMDRISEIRPELSYAQPNQMFVNEAGRSFADQSASLGPSLSVADVSRAAAVADYDNDGDIDLLVTNEGGQTNLLRNDGGSSRHWLIIELVGAIHPDALGSRVTVTAGGIRQTRERQSGGSYLSANDHRLHFGLGSADRADVTVHWPDGSVQVIGEVAADQILRVVRSRL